MEGFIVLLVLIVLGLPLAGFIWLIVRTSRAVESLRHLEMRVDLLQGELRKLRQPPAAPAPAPTPEPPPVPTATTASQRPAPPAVAGGATVPVAAVPPPPVMPPAPPIPPAPVVPVHVPTEAELDAMDYGPAQPPTPPVAPPVLPKPVAPPSITPPEPPVAEEPRWQMPSVDWEQFMGVKLFAWIGGFALFLGLIFFLKYAFENNLISPPLQVAGEYLLAVGVLVGGVMLQRKQLAVLMQTLCATGVLMLYAVTFAGRAYYHLLPVPVAFGVMALVTATAFLLAVRLDAQVVAVLGLVGGFLTPVLLSTGQDNPLGLFSYIALLDIGLIAVALRKRWSYLVMLGALGTVILQVGWALKFFAPAKIYIALAVFIGFEALFLGAVWLARRRGQMDQWFGGAGAVLGFVPFWCTLFLLNNSAMAGRPWHIFALVLAADAGLIWLVRQTQWRPLVIVAALGTALAQFMWLAHQFVAPHWGTALVLALGFEALFAVALVIARRLNAADESVTDWFATAAAGMALMPFWFAVQLLDHKSVGERVEIYFAFVLAGAVGLLGLALRTRRTWLALVGMVATALLEALWVEKFFVVGKTLSAMGVFLGFDVLFLAAFALTSGLGFQPKSADGQSDDTHGQDARATDPWITAAAIGMAFVPVVFALYLLGYRDVAAGQPTLFFGFLLLADLMFVVLALRRVTLASVQMAAGGAVFLVLAIWTGKYVSTTLLYWSLGMNLLFAALHAVFPVVLKRRQPDAVSAGWWQLFPLVSLALVTFPILRMPEVSWAVWLAVLLLDAVIFVLATLAAAVIAMIGVIVFTLALAALWIFRVPVVDPPLTALLLVIGGFAVFFFVVSWLVVRSIAKAGTTLQFGEGWGLPPSWAVPEKLQAQLPAMGAVLPFVLLMMVLARLTLASPAPVFGLALLLVVLLLGVVWASSLDLLAALALGCTCLLELIWRTRPGVLESESVAVTVGWNLIFYGVFTAFPFVFRYRMQSRGLVWAVSALAGPLHLWLAYDPIKAAWPGLVPMMGLVPAAFAVPAMLGLVVLLRTASGTGILPVGASAELLGKMPKPLLAQLAWFGGATLFFVTLIFPVQFERQWITISWALEGAALLWLYQRVPHRGLTWVGVGLLVTAFVRLALNPAVLEYHSRSTTPILNWYLYAYGITAACLFVGANLLRVTGGVPGGRAVLATLGTVLAFLLLNIEIADYFTPAGTTTLTFEFSGNFTRDMTYSIAWAAFALVLLIAGIARKLRAARYASLALLGVTLVKLFVHDLRQLGQLQRIGAFVGVAVILLAASFLYQRFVPAEAKDK